MRKEEVYRKTKETEVKVQVNLDGEGKVNVCSPVPFLNHMLTSLATHSLIDITASVKGDLVHHSIEDLAIGLGEALNKALGTREGIARFGNAAAPMDCSLAFAAVDLVKRPYFKIDLKLRGKKVEEMPAEEGFPAYLPSRLASFYERAGLVTGICPLHITAALFSIAAVFRVRQK